MTPIMAGRTEQPTRLRVRAVTLLLGLLFIAWWQHAVFRAYQYTMEYRVKATGNHAERRFAYFLYYLNLFPVVSTNSGLDYEYAFGKEYVDPQPSTLTYSREAAERIFAEEPGTLMTEWGHTIRTGNLLRSYLYLPHAWWRGTGDHTRLELIFTHVLVFTGALMALYFAFWWLHRSLLGFFLALLIGSNPFQIYEMYFRDNIFGWPIATFCLVLALSVPFLARRKTWRGYYWIAPILTGLLLATTHQIRPENTVMLLVAMCAYLTAGILRWHVRVALVLVLCVTFLVGVRCWEGFFDRKVAEATARVAAAGGDPYRGPRDRYHQFWHSVWIGLGDFDNKYGYAYEDHVAIAYAQPMLRERYHEEMPWWWGVSGKYEKGRSDEDYYDKAKRYYRLPAETPHYFEVLRDKVLHDITHDPWWYVDILRQRARRILDQTTPLQIFIPPLGKVTIPFHGLLVIPIFLLGVATRNALTCKLIVLSLPLSLVALTIYSGGNTPYYSVYHLCAAAAAAAWLAEFACQRGRGRMLTGLMRWLRGRKQDTVKAYWRNKPNSCAHGPIIFGAIREDERRALTRVLEFGASWGGNLQYLMERLPGLQTVGVDINPVVVELAKAQQGYTGMVGDERALAQFPDRAFSLAFTVSVLDHIPHDDVVEEIISHLLRVAERVILVEPWIDGVHREVSGKIRNAIKPGLPRGHKPFAPHCFVWDYDAMLRQQQVEWHKTPMPLHEASLGPFYHLYDIRPRTGVSVGMVAA